MLKWIKKIDDGLERVERGLAVLLFSLLISLICINIFAQYLFQRVSCSLVELSPTIALWLALVGAALALKHHRHINIELLLGFLPPAGRRMVQGITNIFAMGVCGVLTYAAVLFVRNEIILSGFKGWLSICIPFFFATSCLRFSIQFITLWETAKGERP